MDVTADLLVGLGVDAKKVRPAPLPLPYATPLRSHPLGLVFAFRAVKWVARRKSHQQDHAWPPWWLILARQAHLPGGAPVLRGACGGWPISPHPKAADTGVIDVK